MGADGNGTPKKNKGWENLRPAKPGEHRNPHGRPRKGLALADIVQEFLEAPDPKAKSDVRPRLIRALDGVYKSACHGAAASLESLLNRAYGKPIERMEHVTTERHEERTIRLLSDPVAREAAAVLTERALYRAPQSGGNGRLDE